MPTTRAHTETPNRRTAAKIPAMEARINTTGTEVLGVPASSTIYYMNGLEVHSHVMAHTGSPRRVLIEPWGGDMAPDTDPKVTIDNMVQTRCSNPCPNDPYADVDGDGDVDQDDFAEFQACYTGSGEFELSLSCACFNRDNWDSGDTDVDDADFTAFQNCASGPNVPVTASCDD